MFTLMFPPVSVKMTHIISVLKMQVKIGSPSSQACTLNAWYKLNILRVYTHNKIVSEIGHSDCTNSDQRNFPFQRCRYSSILGCRYNKVDRFIRLKISRMIRSVDVTYDNQESRR